MNSEDLLKSRRIAKWFSIMSFQQNVKICLLLSRNISGPMVHVACMTKEEVLSPHGKRTF